MLSSRFILQYLKLLLLLPLLTLPEQLIPSNCQSSHLHHSTTLPYSIIKLISLFFLNCETMQMFLLYRNIRSKNEEPETSLYSLIIQYRLFTTVNFGLYHSCYLLGRDTQGSCHHPPLLCCGSSSTSRDSPGHRGASQSGSLD